MPEITYTSRRLLSNCCCKWLSRSTWLSFFWALLLLYSIGNWSLPLIDRDEPRFAEASREMRQSGDFLIPRLNGEYRFDKPPLDLLVPGPVIRCFRGERFRRAISFGGFCCSYRRRDVDLFEPDLRPTRRFLVRNHLRNQSSGFYPCAGCRSRYATGFLFSHRDVGRLGTAKKSESQILVVDILSLALGFGFLAKGPVALLPAFFAPVQSFLNRAPCHWKLRSILLGGLVVLIVIGLWGIPALIATNGAYLQIGLGKQVLQRSLQPMESHGGAGLAGYLLFLPFYLVVSFFSFFPWCFFLPGCVKRLLAHREPDEDYLLGPILIVLFVFTLIQTKLPHYVLPAYPMLAILVARQAAESKWKRGLLGITLVLYLLVAIVGFQSDRIGISVEEHCQNRTSSRSPQKREQHRSTTTSKV